MTPRAKNPRYADGWWGIKVVVAILAAGIFAVSAVVWIMG